MEQTFYIPTIDAVKSIVKITTAYTLDIDAQYENNVVDAKSFMGLMSLDLQKPITIRVHTDNKYLADDIFNKISEVLN